MLRSGRTFVIIKLNYILVRLNHMLDQLSDEACDVKQMACGLLGHQENCEAEKD